MISEILPNLFLSDLQSIQDGNGKGKIICVLENLPDVEPEDALWIPIIKRKLEKVPIPESKGGYEWREYISHAIPQQLDLVANNIAMFLEDGGRVTVHCIHPDTIISDYLPNKLDNLTHAFGMDGKRYRINNKQIHEGHKKLLEIKTIGTLPLKCTLEHMLLIYRPYVEKRGIKIRPNKFKHKNYKHIIEYNKLQPIWVKAEDLQMGDFLLSPKIDYKNIKEPMFELSKSKNATKIKFDFDDPDILYLFGFYIGDGGKNDNANAEITLSKNDDKKKVIRALKKLGINPFVKEYKNYTKIRIHSTNLVSNFINWFGSYSNNKHIPEFLLKPNRISHVLKGLFDADGTYQRKTYTLTTISRQLALQVWHILVSQEKNPTIRTVKYMKNKKKNAKTQYQVCYVDHKTNHQTCYLGDYYCMPVKEIKEINYSSMVYDLEVDKSHSYLANGIISHNCAAAEERSPLAVMWYLVQYKHCKNLEEAFKFVKEKHQIAQYRLDWIPGYSRSIIE